jgi:serine/threonine protein kinase
MKSVQEVLAFLKQADRYSRVRELGSGGMGSVDAVLDTVLQRVVARKRINSEHMTHPEVVETFVNEIKLMARLTHPGILAMHDALLGAGGEPAYTMPLAEGRTLQSLLKEQSGRPLPLEQAVRILVKLSETLTFAHDRGILHLDLKPENIMVGEYGEVLIMDWGAARVFDAGLYNAEFERLAGGAAVPEQPRETEGLIMGTPGYMPPEQIRDGRAALGPEADIFAVGVIFYQMITGTHPFMDTTLRGIEDRVFDHEPPAASTVNPDVPSSLARISAKMLHKDRSGRYRRFKEVLNALDEYQRSAAGFPTRTFEAGEVIFSEGDPSDYICIVESGSVEISVDTDGDRKVIATLGRGEPFGELAAITGNPRTATATAVEASTIRMVTRDDIGAEIEKLSSWVGAIVEALTNRFIEISERLLELEKQSRN